LLLLALAMLVLGVLSSCTDPEHSRDHPSGSFTDSSVQDEDRRSSTNGTERGDDHVSLVGALKGDLSEYNTGVFGDVAGYKNLAFVGKWYKGCPGSGVDIIDISQPLDPVKLSDTNDYSDTSMEDMQAIEIGGRDILAIGLQDCEEDSTPSVGKRGLELYDITNPRDPRFLSLFDTDSFGTDSGGVHELDLTGTPGGEVLALGAVPDLETNSSDSDKKNGIGDLLIWDITDPTNPTLVGEWGVLDEPSLDSSLYDAVRQGGDDRTLLHSPRANPDGTRAYVSYWDAGVIMLDISDPSDPVYLGRTSYEEGEEGNAHSVDEARDGTILIQADEDLSPFEFEFTSNAFSGKRFMIEAPFAPSVVDLAGRKTDGEVVHVGRACPTGSIDGSDSADPYLADPSGKIALIEGGGCLYDNKIARAQLVGATGAIVYNSADGGEEPIYMGGNDPVTLPDGLVVDIDIPVVSVERSTGLLLRDGTSPVTASAAAVFNGWGYLRFFDIRDPANPEQLSVFATENTNDETAATEGRWWSAHNPEVRGNTVYASWFSDGVRVIDISDPSSPRETSSWTGEGTPEDAPAVEIWSVVPYGDLLLASDRNYGLYILKHTS
jgi:hypothetical protein